MSEKDDKLISYFIERTDTRLGKIENILTDLTKFKVEMLSSAKWASIIISSLVGLTAFVITLGVSIHYSREEIAALRAEQITVKEQK